MVARLETRKAVRKLLQYIAIAIYIYLSLLENAEFKGGDDMAWIWVVVMNLVRVAKSRIYLKYV